MTQPIGALTSKPYAFSARPWELKDTSSIDIFDSVGSGLRFGSRGNTILRVLPRVNEQTNEEWLSDKSRFSFDAFASVQRIIDPEVLGEVVPWSELYPSFVSPSPIVREFPVGRDTPPRPINFMVGPFVDHETLVSIDSFGQFLENRVSSFGSQARVLEQRQDYISDTLLQDPMGDLLFINFNPRLEAPVFNMKIRRAVVGKSLGVFSLGFYGSYNYKTHSVGSGIKDLVRVLEGRSALVSRTNVLPVVGSSLSRQMDLAKLLQTLRTVFGRATSFHPDASSLNYHEVGPVSDVSGYHPVSWSLGDDVLFTSGVYQGHHHDVGSNLADMVIPSSLFTEKDGSYYNCFGSLQKTRFVTNSVPGHNIKPDAEILNFLSGSNPSDSRPVQKIKVFGLRPFGVFFLRKGHLLGNNMGNFYQNDPISRSSPTMGLVSSRSFSKKNSFSPR